jgi:predicted PurR-regulated permease PerM
VMDKEKINKILFYSILGLVGLLFLFIIQPFLFPIFWAAVIAGIFHPAFLYLNRRLSSANLAALLVMVAILVIIILPAIAIGSILLAESVDLYHSLEMGTVSIQQQIDHMTRTMTHFKYLDKLPIDTAVVSNAVADGAKGIANYIFQNLRDLTQNTVIFAAKFAIMLYTLFFFIRDGAFFVAALSRLLPLGNQREKLLFKSFGVTARATLKVTLIIGGLQGALGGLLFFALGVKGALTWGVIMIFSSIIPGVGCAIVWAPAGAIMLLLGYFWKGIIILAFGLLVISMVDNLLRPLLLGHDVQMHPLLIFLSTLGGIMFFGMSGFVLGPIVASLLLAFWRMYDDLNHQNAV